MFEIYFEALTNPQESRNRIIRKAAILAVICVIYFVYDQHAVEYKGLDSIHWTVIYSIIIFVIAGPIGGGIAADIYESHLKSLGSNSSFKPNSSTFFIECLLALSAPVFGYLMLLIFVSMGWKYN